MQGGTLAEPMVTRKRDLRHAVNLIAGVPNVWQRTRAAVAETPDHPSACDQIHTLRDMPNTCRDDADAALFAPLYNEPESDSSIATDETIP